MSKRLLRVFGLFLAQDDTIVELFLPKLGPVEVGILMLGNTTVGQRVHKR